MRSTVPLRVLVLADGRADRIVTGDDLAALLAGDDHVRLWLCSPCGLVPLQLFVRLPESGSWQVVLPGIAGETEPVLLATITADGQP